MKEMRQSTIDTEIAFNGVGLHTGEESSVVLRPASAGTGIVFRRRDLDGHDGGKTNLIAAKPGNVIACDHGTTLANEAGVSVATVEHLMAAFALARVDNVLVDLNGPEIPIFDGSAAPYIERLQAGGLRRQTALRRAIMLDTPLRIDDGDRFIEFLPALRPSIAIEIDFGDCLIGRQSLRLDLENDEDVERIASARTFCRLNEIDGLREAGLIRGGSLKNALVVDGERLLNEEALRDPQEFALHKALDLLGDLYLLGRPICAAIRAHKPGHGLNVRAGAALARVAAMPIPAHEAAQAISA